MLFNSFAFPGFLILFLGLYYALPHRVRPVWILVASVFFYMAAIPQYIAVLFFLILVDYGAGIRIENAGSERARKLWLWLSMAANISLLGVFKYYNFFGANLNALFSALGLNIPIPLHSWVLPVGLSFHTFQSMAYTIEVFQRRHPAERNLLTYANYVLFWPQLVAGPIERPQNLFPQLKARKAFSSAAFVVGLRLILLGAFKKIVIADRLGIYVDPIFNSPQAYSGLPLWIATYFFTIQIYCDFSGYTDIARGCARCLGIELSMNFNLPYRAVSLADFWRRWHISLSSWFRDYLYQPLREKAVGRGAARLAVFAVSGLWHGANWTFVAWGLLHAAYLVIGQATQSARESLAVSSGLTRFPRLHTGLKIFLTFHLVAFSWIFFRAKSLGDAGYIITHLFSGISDTPESIGLLTFSRLGLRFQWIALLLVAQWIAQRKPWNDWLNERPGWLRFGLYYGGVLTVATLGVFGQTQFIYFQF